MDNLKKFYKNKKILITGHTGFKGSWLSSSLLLLGSRVYGYSLNDEKKKSYKKICEYQKIKNIYGDILDYKKLQKNILKIKPEIIFHLAAQPLVSVSYKKPYQTIQTNLIGTLNIMEICRKVPNLRALVLITSDKCYHNIEIKRGYKESDRLGGEDPYSSSKACAEIVYHSYLNSFFNKKNNLGVATARAGNVIGGGDWSQDRIIPDCVRSIIKNKKLIIRNPSSTRPWQHVLEPLSGYLILAMKLSKEPAKYAGSWNFGPIRNEKMRVKYIVKLLFTYLKKREFFIIKKGKFKEANLLKLNSNKSTKILNWKSKWRMKETIIQTALWYQNFINKKNVKDFTKVQIRNYFGIK